MAIVSIDAMIEYLREVVGDRTDDRTLEIVSDMTDTINGYRDEEKKLRDLDEAWRKKYRDRFFSDEKTETEEKDVFFEKDGKEENLTYEKLFKEG